MCMSAVCACVCVRVSERASEGVVHVLYVSSVPCGSSQELASSTTTRLAYANNSLTFILSSLSSGFVSTGTSTAQLPLTSDEFNSTPNIHILVTR